MVTCRAKVERGLRSYFLAKPTFVSDLEPRSNFESSCQPSRNLTWNDHENKLLVRDFAVRDFFARGMEKSRGRKIVISCRYQTKQKMTFVLVDVENCNFLDENAEKK